MSKWKKTDEVRKRMEKGNEKMRKEREGVGEIYRYRRRKKEGEKMESAKRKSWIQLKRRERNERCKKTKNLARQSREERGGGGVERAKRRSWIQLKRREGG